MISPSREPANPASSLRTDRIIGKSGKEICLGVTRFEKKAVVGERKRRLLLPLTHSGMRYGNWLSKLQEHPYVLSGGAQLPLCAEEAGGTENLGKARFQVLSTKNYGTTVPRPPKMSGTSAIDYQGGQRDGNHSYRNTGIVADRRASDLAL